MPEEATGEDEDVDEAEKQKNDTFMLVSCG